MVEGLISFRSDEPEGIENALVAYEQMFIANQRSPIRESQVHQAVALVAPTRGRPGRPWQFGVDDPTRRACHYRQVDLLDPDPAANRRLIHAADHRTSRTDHAQVKAAR